MKIKIEAQDEKSHKRLEALIRRIAKARARRVELIYGVA